MQRRSDEELKALIEEQAESGLSQVKFCEERGITVSSFQWRKRKLEQLFLELAVASTEAKGERGKHEAKLELSGGVRFRMSWSC